VDRHARAAPVDVFVTRFDTDFQAGRPGAASVSLSVAVHFQVVDTRHGGMWSSNLKSKPESSAAEPEPEWPVKSRASHSQGKVYFVIYCGTVLALSDSGTDSTASLSGKTVLQKIPQPRVLHLRL